MVNELFWQIVEDAKSRAGKNQERQLQLIAKRLESISDSDLLTFCRSLAELLHRADSWDLVNAVAVMEGWVSDDFFEYWRAALLLQGQSVVEQAIQDPDSLADQEYFDRCQDFLDLPWTEFQRRHGEDAVPPSPHLGDNIQGPNPISQWQQLLLKYPRLMRKYWGRWPYGSPVYPDATPID